MSKTSINPLNGNEYLLPTNNNDKKKIDLFLKSNIGKKVIVVQGLGFVGAVMSLVCANAHSEEYAVIGLDIANKNNYWKIKSINDGVFPVIASDPKIEEFYNISKKKNNFFATFDTYVGEACQKRLGILSGFST